MSTHYSRCVVCGAKTACSADEHALGAGRDCCCGDKPELAIEFCSLACFEELQQHMERRLAISKELYPEWFRQPIA